MALSIFTPSATGMTAQSTALGTVSTNIANMNTTGYKTSETMFYTLLGSQPIAKGHAGLSTSRTDIDGVGSYTRHLIDDQGLVTTTGNQYDVAINGTGNAFFTVKDGADIYYTRAGNFGTRTIDGKTYLVTAGGLMVQGFPANEDGTFAGNIADIEVISPETIPATSTTKMNITANVPAGEQSASYGLTVYNEQNNSGTMTMTFSQVEGAVNTWNINFAIQGGTVTSAEPIEAVFDGDAQLVSPKTFDITVTWEDGSTQTINMDIADITQYAGSNSLTSAEQDGVEAGRYIKSYIDENGVVKATYTNGKTYENAKLAVTSFTSPNNLVPIAGTLFEAYPSAGESSYTDTKGLLVPESLEHSTVSVEEEFSTMLIVQQAYSLNATAFTTSDEMLQELVDLKT